jgi:hypothetical protein
MVVHADGHVGGHLVKGLGNRVQPRDPVVVVLHRSETQLGHQLRVGGVNAAHLVHGHLPLFEIRSLGILGKMAQQKLTADLLLVSQSSGVDGRQPHQEVLFALKPVVDRLHRVIGDLIVVPLVAYRRGKLRGMLESVFPVVRKDSIESLPVCLDRC